MFIILIITLITIESVFGANILYVSHMPSPSHHLWNRAFALGLVNKRHNVTLIDPDFENLPERTNYSHIIMEGVYEALDVDFDINSLDSVSPLGMIKLYEDFCVLGCKHSLKSEGLKNLLNYPNDFKFDLIIFDITSGVCLYPLIHRFNYPPTIAATAFLLPSYISYNFGNNLHPSYIPWYALPYTQDMTFFERLQNTFMMYLDTFLKRNRQNSIEYKAAQEIFGDKIPSVEKLERHISLVLANTDPVLSYPQPLSSNIIPVGGLHTRKSSKLPLDLQEILDKATKGAIVFSLGTNIRSDKLSKTTQKALLNAFSKIPYTVLWKFESDIDNIPKNVLIRKWLPQNDLLGHPNVKLFIGHGGALSTQEAIFHGVPMICIPFIVDQYINTNLIVNKKLGVKADISLVTQNYMLQKIKEVLENPIYAENMQKISKLYHDKLTTPLDKAVFWAEHVIRHGGAEYLNSPARDMSFYKVSGLDIIGFLLVVLIVIFVALYKLLLLVLSSFSKNTKVKTN